MALNTQNFLQSKASNQEKQCKIQQQNEITTHAYNRKKKGTQPIEPKPLLFSFLLQNKTNTTKWRSSHGKKNKGSLKANFLSYHHYLMKALDCNINKKNKEEKPQKDHTEEKREIISETHLTASGVCTTICPENSGM